MKTPLALLAFALATSSPLAASDAFLIKAASVVTEDSRSVARGGAALLARGGQTKVTADTMVYDQRSGTVTFSGAVKIHADGAIIETDRASLDVSRQRVFLLSGGRVTPAGGEALDASQSAELEASFGRRLAPTQTTLPREMPKPRSAP